MIIEFKLISCKLLKLLWLSNDFFQIDIVKYNIWVRILECKYVFIERENHIPSLMLSWRIDFKHNFVTQNFKASNWFFSPSYDIIAVFCKDKLVTCFFKFYLINFSIFPIIETDNFCFMGECIDRGILWLCESLNVWNHSQFLSSEIEDK